MADSIVWQNISNKPPPTGWSTFLVLPASPPPFSSPPSSAPLIQYDRVSLVREVKVNFKYWSPYKKCASCKNFTQQGRNYNLSSEVIILWGGRLGGAGWEEWPPLCNRRGASGVQPTLGKVIHKGVLWREAQLSRHEFVISKWVLSQKIGNNSNNKNGGI